FLRAEPGEFGPLADAHDLALGDADCTIVDDAERVCRTGAFQRRDPAVDEQPVPHDPALRRATLVGQSCDWLAEPLRADRPRGRWGAHRAAWGAACCRVDHAGALRSRSGASPTD